VDPRVTSVDVARAAGVSQSTVSLVLSGKSRGRISGRTEEAVRRAAEDLGYRPNVSARALRTGATRTVGFVVPDVTHPFFGRTMRGAQQAAAKAGYAVMLVDVPGDGDWGLTPVEALREGPADGFIYFSVEPPAHRHRGEHMVVIEAAPGDLPGCAWTRREAPTPPSSTCSSSGTGGSHGWAPGRTSRRSSCAGSAGWRRWSAPESSPCPS
jgi:DNA-binding LacI/PurR family transcriptional regulator